MNINGKIKVKAKVNDMTGKVDYQTVLASKNKNGESSFWWVQLNFVKDANNALIDNDSYIDVKEGFLTFYKKVSHKKEIVDGVKCDNEVYVEECIPKFVISKYEVAEAKTNDLEMTFPENLDDNDLPF